MVSQFFNRFKHKQAGDSVGGVLGLFAKDKEMWPRVEKSKLCLHFLSQFVSQVSFIGNNVNLAWKSKNLQVKWVQKFASLAPQSCVARVKWKAEDNTDSRNVTYFKWTLFFKWKFPWMGYSFQRTKMKIDKAKVKMNMSKTFILSTDLVEFLCILGCVCKFPLKLLFQVLIIQRLMPSS